MIRYFDGLVQDCSNCIALAMELLQSCTKPSIFILNHFFFQDGGEGYFAIAGAASEGFIVLQQPLDYDEGQRQYALNVTVRVSENKNYSALPRRVPLTHWLLGDVEAILQEYLFNSFHELITKGTFTHARADAGGGGRKIGFNTNHYMRSHMRGRGAEAEREQKPLRKKWVQHPIYRARLETARSKPALSSRNGRSARVRSSYVWTYPR